MATLTKDGIIKRLQAKGTNPNCEVCGRASWVVPEDEGDPMLLSIPIMQTGNTFRMPSPSVPVIMIICGHCGNVRTHAMGVLAPEAMKP